MNQKLSKHLRDSFVKHFKREPTKTEQRQIKKSVQELDRTKKLWKSKRY